MQILQHFRNNTEHIKNVNIKIERTLKAVQKDKETLQFIIECVLVRMVNTDFFITSKPNNLSYKKINYSNLIKHGQHAQIFLQFPIEVCKILRKEIITLYRTFKSLYCIKLIKKRLQF